MKTVLPVIVGHTDGASSQATTRSTAGDRSHTPAEQFENIRDDRPCVDPAGHESHPAVYIGNSSISTAW